MKKKIIVLALLVIAAAAIYHFKIKPDDAKQNGTLVLYGNVDIREVALGFRVPGRLAHLNYEEGDRVEIGAELAQLDKQPLTEELAVRQAQVKEISADLANAEKTFKRNADLVKKGSVSTSDYDDALALRDALKARLETAKAQLTQAETALADANLLAPASGTLLTRVKEPGSILAVGTTVYTLALDQPVWVRTYIDEPNLGKIYPGQKVSVTTDSGQSYTGQIGFISPQAEFTPKTVETTQLRTSLVYRLRVIVLEADQHLRQGMPVSIHF